MPDLGSCGLTSAVLGPVAGGVTCLPSAVSGAAGAVVQSGFEATARAMGEGFADLLKQVMTFWTKVDLGKGLDLGSGGTVALLQQLSWWLVLVVATFGAIVAGASLVWNRDMREGQQLVKGVMRVVIVAGSGAAVISALASGSDAASTWILDRASASTGGFERLGSIAAGLSSISPGVLFIVALIGLLTSLGQVVLLMLRAAFITLMAGVLPIAAAASMTRSGTEWFNRLTAYTLAVIAYKPVAALIYAAAFKMMSDSNGTGMIGVVQGLALVVMAVVALPALMRLLVPAVGAVASSGGGGMLMAAAAGAGALAQGAQVLTGRGGAGQAPQGPPQPPPPGNPPSGAPASPGLALSGRSALPAGPVGAPGFAGTSAAASGSSASAGAGTGAASGAASGAAAAGGAGAALVAGVQVARAGRDAVAGTTGDAGSGSGSGSGADGARDRGVS